MEDKTFSIFGGEEGAGLSQPRLDDIVGDLKIDVYIYLIKVLLTTHHFSVGR
jgi:hypothetical protein